MEVQKLGPKRLEAEASSTKRGVARCQDQRAVIGTRRGSSRQPVGGEERLPAYITEELIYANQHGVLPFITPGEPPILEVDFFKLTTTESFTEPVDSTGVNIPLVFIPCPINLVEVLGGDPSDSNRRLLANELCKERVLNRGVGP